MEGLKLYIFPDIGSVIMTIHFQKELKKKVTEQMYQNFWPVYHFKSDSIFFFGNLYSFT